MRAHISCSRWWVFFCYFSETQAEMTVLVAHRLTLRGRRWQVSNSETPRSTLGEQNDNNWQKNQAHKSIFHFAAVTLRTHGMIEKNDGVAIVTEKCSSAKTRQWISAVKCLWGYRKVCWNGLIMFKCVLPGVISLMLTLEKGFFHIHTNYKYECMCYLIHIGTITSSLLRVITKISFPC